MKALLLTLLVSISLNAAVLDEKFDINTLEGKRVGYYIGSFDPIHLGHQHVIDTALRLGYVDYILIYPAPGNDRFKQRTAQDARLRMIASLYRDHPRALITAWTPKELQDHFAFKEIEIIGIIGSDIVIENMRGPDLSLREVYAERFMRGLPLPEKHFNSSMGAVMALKANSFIVALRGEVDLTALGETIHGREILALIPSTTHSSTRARAAVYTHEETGPLLAPSVYEIIQREGLYQ